MKRFIVLILALAAAPIVFGQATNRSSSADKPATNVINDLNQYAPTFPFLRSTDSAKDEKDFETIKKLLDEVQNDYLVRVLIKAQRTIDEYKLNHPGLKLDEFASSMDYYRIVHRTMEISPNIRLGIDQLDKAFAVFAYVKPSLLVDGNRSNDVRTIEYRLYMYDGILNLFYGTQVSMKRAWKDFNFLLENKLVTDENEVIMILTYLAGMNFNFAEQNGADIVMRRYYVNNMFDNLWDITELRNKGDAQKKDYKLMHLVKEYAVVINPTTERFKTRYQPFFDKLGLNYGKTEERTIESAGKSGDTSKAATTTTPATGGGK
ncbi:MAG: hypothetical protein AABZ39_11065 [Spirochaetota bacterium]